MSYLLSDGTISTNWKEAVIDALMIRIQLAPNTTPWYSKGLDKVVLSIKRKDIEDALKSRIMDIVTDINAKYSCNLTVSDLSLNPDGTYSIRVKLNGYEREIYSNYRARNSSHL